MLIREGIECLIKDRKASWRPSTFPPTTRNTINVIESLFATNGHRAVRSKRRQWNKTTLAMSFKHAEAAEKSWRRLNGHNQLPEVTLGARFTDGIEVVRSQDQAAAAGPFGHW